MFQNTANTKWRLIPIHISGPDYCSGNMLIKTAYPASWDLYCVTPSFGVYTEEQAKMKTFSFFSPGLLDETDTSTFRGHSDHYNQL